MVSGAILRVKREAGQIPAQQPLLCFVMRLQQPLGRCLRRCRRGSHTPHNQPEDLPYVHERPFLGQTEK